MDWITEYDTASVFELIKQTYKTETGHDMQIGSDEFAISTVVAYVFGVLINAFNSKSKQRFLATATGEYLDGFGDNFDLPRPPAIHAAVEVYVEVNQNTILTPNEFIIADDNGVSFTPLQLTELPTSANVLFVGCQNDNVLDENNILSDKIKNILTPLSSVISVSNTQISGGAAEPFPYTDEGDDAYRAYIHANRAAQSVAGPGAAYERRAINCDARVLDAYCLRFDDPGYQPGKAIIYVNIYETGVAAPNTDALNRVKAELSKDDFRPTGDDVIVRQANVITNTVQVEVGFDRQFALSGQQKAERDFVSYQASVSTTIGRAWSLSELAKMLLTPDKDGIKALYIKTDMHQFNYLQCGIGEVNNVTVSATYAFI